MTWDKPYPKEMWDAFLQDLEGEATEYVDEIVASIRGNQDEVALLQEVQRVLGYQSVLDEVYAILREANPYHDTRGRFARGGHGGGRKAKGPVTSAVVDTLGPDASGRMSATTGVVNRLLKLGGHDAHFKAVSLTHGGVKLVPIGDMTDSERRHAESNALGALMAHGAMIRRHAATGEMHITHFQNPSETASTGHVARVKGKQGKATATGRDPATVRKEMLAWHEQRQADLAAASEKSAKSYQAYNAHVSKWLKAKDELGADHPTVQMMAKHEQFLGDIMERDRAAAKQLYDTRTSELKDRFIYQKPGKYKLGVAKGTAKDLTTAEKQRWQEGFEEFRKIAGPSMDPFIATNSFHGLTAQQKKQIGVSATPTVYFTTTTTGRSFNREGQVNMERNGSVATVVHELGHTLEHSNPEVAASRRAFYDERTRGEKLQKLSKLTGHSGYRSDEEARPDEFTHAYMGKDYGTTGSIDRYSEMVSMGVQMLHENPVHLAKTDPEYFDWIYSVTHGQASWRPQPHHVPGDHVKITGGTHAGKTGKIAIKRHGDDPYTVELPGGHLWSVDPAHLERVNP